MPHALVTGASKGIGLELSERFAKDGHDLVLVARSEDALHALAERLRSAHGRDVRVVAADLSRPEAPEAIARAVDDLDIGFLVNNAGFGSNGPFVEQDLARELSMVQVNVSALVALTHLLLPKMIARGAGRVLNIASTAGFQPGPLMATYYATKAFVISFSEAIAHEVKGTGVTVTCHCPGATDTAFATTAGNHDSKLFKQGKIAGPAEVAEHAYRAMMKGEVLSVHGALNKVGAFSVRLAPRGLVRGLAAGVNAKA